MAKPTGHISIGAKFSQTIIAVVYGTFNVFSYFLILASGVLVHTAIISLLYYVLFVRRQKTWFEASGMDSAASIIMPTWILTMITFAASLALQDEPFWLRIACIVVGIWTAIICLVLLGSLVFLIVVLIYAVVSVATKKDLPTSDPKKSTVGTVEDNKSAVGSSG